MFPGLSFILAPSPSSGIEEPLLFDSNMRGGLNQILVIEWTHCDIKLRLKNVVLKRAIVGISGSDTTFGLQNMLKRERNTPEQ